MSESWGGSASGADDPATGMGPVLPASRFGAGYTVGESGPSAAPPYPPSTTHPGAGRSDQHVTAPPASVAPSGLHESTWHAAAAPAQSATPSWTPSAPPVSPPASGWGQGQHPGPIPSAPQRRIGSTAIVFIGAVLLICGAFLAGRVTAPKSGMPVVAPTDASGGALVPPGGASTTASAVVPSTGLTVADAAGDAVPHPTSDGKVYGPSDIVDFSVRSEGANLVITTRYTPATPMNLISTGTRIRLNPDLVPSCKDSVLDSFDWSIDYDTGGVEVYRPALSCGDRYQPSTITGAATITGSTLTIKVNQNSLGIRPGQRVVVRTCVSTRIDDGHTTFIQDWAPDSPGGATGTP